MIFGASSPLPYDMFDHAYTDAEARRARVGVVEQWGHRSAHANA